MDLQKKVLKKDKRLTVTALLVIIKTANLKSGGENMAFMFGVIPMILLSPVLMAGEVLEKAFDVVAPFIQNILSILF